MYEDSNSIEITDDLVWPLFILARDRPELLNPKTRREIMKKTSLIRSDWHSKSKTFKNCLNSRVPLKPETLEKIPERSDKIILLIDYYNVQDEERRKEIIFAIQKNIDCGHFHKIYIFLEKNDQRSNEELANDFYVQINVQFIRDCRRSTYRSFLDFIKNETPEEESDAVFILSNNDCYFDDSVNLFKHLPFNWGKTIYSMTRKDLLSDGRIIDAMHPQQLYGNIPDVDNLPEALDVKHVRESEQILGPDSSDAWAFKKKLTDTSVDLNFELGRYHCENQFLGRLKSNGYNPKNIGFCGHVRCIHVHQSFWRKMSTTIYDPSDSDYYNFNFMPPFFDPENQKSRTLDNCIAGTNSVIHKNNYFYTDQFSANLENYVITDINKYLTNE